MRIAAIDVGSNSIHMVVAEVEKDGRFQVLDRAKEMVRLGHGALDSGRLSATSIAAGIRTLAAFRRLAERQGAQRFKAVATSAVREAVNGGDFIERAQREVGLRVKVIPGREEARLIYLGVRQAVDLRGAATLIADAGGGSLELVLTEDERPVALHSLKLGVARLSERFVSAEAPGGQGMARLERYLAAQLEPVLAPMATRGVRRLVGTAGTLLNLIGMAAYQRGESPDGQLNRCVATAEDVAALRRLIAKADRAERLRIKGLDAKRVDFVVPGVCLADYLVRRLDAKEIVACTWGLREGVLLDFIARHRSGIAEIENFADLRHRSVARFVRHLGGAEAHGQHVAHLALQLYDQLHARLRLDAEAREWLEFAALLHDVGHRIDHENHHRHAYYLITNGELLGFSRDELEVIGLVARYHRKGTPKASDPAYAALPRARRRAVRTLSGILRLADALDRSHYGVVRAVTAVPRGVRLTLQLHAVDDAELETWEARRRVHLLEKVLGMEISLRIAAETRPAQLAC